MELSNYKYNPLKPEEGLDIPIYRNKGGRPSIELIGKGDKLIIDKQNKRWHIEGRFNPNTPLNYEAYCLFTPIEDKKNPILLKGKVDGPKPELGLPFNPILEGSINELFEVIDWKSPIKNYDPFTLSRRLDLAVKYKVETQLNKAILKNLLEDNKLNDNKLDNQSPKSNSSKTTRKKRTNKTKSKESSSDKQETQKVNDNV